MFVIGSKKTGYGMGHSSTGSLLGPVFETLPEIFHFIGFWMTLHEKNVWEDVHSIWYDEYMDDNEKFNGKLSDWDFENLSVETNLLDDSKKTHSKKTHSKKTSKKEVNKLSGMTVVELKELCKKKNITGYSKLKKDELIKLCSKNKKSRK